MAQAEFRRFASETLRAFISDALVAAGLPAQDAAKCATLMSEADLTGADAHGIFRLPQYVRRLKAGGFNAHPAITVTRSAPATALVDGDNGMGHLVMSRAAETAVVLAREAGVAWVGVKRSNHAGPAGLYAEMPAAAGMIGLYTAVANANHMAVWGGADLGTADRRKTAGHDVHPAGRGQAAGPANHKRVAPGCKSRCRPARLHA